MVISSLDHHGYGCHRRTGRVRPARRFMRNRVSPSRCRQRHANRKERSWR